MSRFLLTVPLLSFADSLPLTSREPTRGTSTHQTFEPRKKVVHRKGAGPRRGRLLAFQLPDRASGQQLIFLSLPGPPLHLSLPGPPFRTSFPAPPFRRSSSPFPLR